MRHSQRQKNPAENAYRVDNALTALMTKIRFQSKERPIRSLVVTSSVSGEGSTTISVALAKSIAASGKHVVLVEGNMRHPTLNSIFSGERQRLGYCDVMDNKVPLEKAVFRLKIPNLYFMNSGMPKMNPAYVLADERVSDIFGRLRSEFDFVIFDTPPVASFVDAAVLANDADGVILVVRPNAAEVKDLLAAKEELANAGARILGICENDYPMNRQRARK